MMAARRMATSLIFAAMIHLPMTASFLAVLPPGSNRLCRERCLQLDSTIDTSSEAPASSPTASVDSKGALSMTVDELAEKLGGWGRARLAWDCYSIGVDPIEYFTARKNQESMLGHDDMKTIYDFIATNRQSQVLGAEALRLLKENNGSIQDVATLSHVSRNKADPTTKLLLKLQDGLEVETVIIPFKRERSTLCVS